MDLVCIFFVGVLLLRLWICFASCSWGGGVFFTFLSFEVGRERWMKLG